jgi:hypothetical protein
VLYWQARIAVAAGQATHQFGGSRLPVHRSPELLLDVVRKAGAMVDRAVIAAPAFVNMVMDELAFTDCVYSDLVPKLWDVIPEAVRDDFVTALRYWVRSDFRYIARHISGGCDEDYWRAAEIPSHRVREWALEFMRYLD